jgi:hypothetical protein
MAKSSVAKSISQASKSAPASKAVVPAIVPAPAPAPAVVAIAPAMGTQGKATKGGHHQAACTKASKATLRALLVPTATLALTNATVCPWRPGSDGHVLFTKVLVPLMSNGQVTTVAVVLAKAAALNHAWRYPAVNHLMWLYTWGGSHLQVNGSLYNVAK